MRTLDLGRAQPKQTLFLRDKHRHIAYGGARGGGKSWAVRTKAKLLAFRYPGIKILIVRKTYKELQNNHIEQLTAELAGFAKYNRSDKMFRFPNGSTISFGYCANEGDLGQYQGAEYDVVFIDEAGQLQESWIRKINLCVRGTNGFPKRTYYTLNPGGPGHAYFKRVFVDRNFNPDERPDDYFFIQAKVEDNKALMDTQPDYLRELENLPPTLRAAWKDGRWDVYEGRRYAGIGSDFSETTKKQFLEYASLATIRWPEDILPAGADYSTAIEAKNQGPYYKLWLEFRAKTIHDFVQRASEAVHKVHPDLKFGCYVGGWYSQYFELGVNWASPKFDTASAFPAWATKNYKNYGYADHCDQILIGAYASPGAVWGSGEWTMQGFCSQAKNKIGGACPLVVGGPDVGNWDSGNKYSQEEENAAIVNSVKACYDSCDGYFLFDMIHLKLADQWQYAKEGIDNALK